MANGQIRDPYEWEWREAENERRRQRARVVARRRGRLRLVAVIVVVAAVVGSALLAASALSLPTPHARAAPVVVNDGTRHNVPAVRVPAASVELVSDAAPARPARRP